MERLSTSRDVAENKLLILYILKKHDIPVGSIDFTNYILNERLMSFMTFQQRVHELIVTDHVNSDTQDGKTYYEITEAGNALLTEMADMLPQTDRNRVDRTLRALRRRTLDERAITAQYIPEDENSGVVRIGLNEGDFSVLSLEIATASKDEASIICRNWKAYAGDIYAGITELLLERRDESDPSSGAPKDV